MSGSQRSSGGFRCTGEGQSAIRVGLIWGFVVAGAGSLSTPAMAQGMSFGQYSAACAANGGHASIQGGVYSCSFSGGGPAAGGNAALNAAAAAAGARARQAFDDWLSGAAAARERIARGNQFNDQGIAAYNAKNWDQAIALFRKAVELNPNPVTRNNLANALVGKVWASANTFGAEAATAKVLQEALSDMAPDNPSRGAVASQLATLQTTLQSASADQQQRQIQEARAKAEDSAAAAFMSKALAGAAVTPPPSGAQGKLDFMAASGATGTTPAFGQRAGPAISDVELGPSASGQQTRYATASAQAQAAAAAGALAAPARGATPPSAETAKALADCAFSGAAGCVGASPLAFNKPEPAPGADALAAALPPGVADRPEVKSALGMYRNAEQNLASAQRDIDRYQSLVDKGGPGAADAKPFLDTAKNQFKLYQQDQTTAKAQVATAVLNLGVAMPPELSQATPAGADQRQ